MHPELFELKALVAGRLDAHRRREIDDHLGSCAECSRHYVAMMLGSASPKTAEAEARQGLVPTGARGGGSNGEGVALYGIDAPIAPSAARPAVRSPHSNIAALETEFRATPARTQVPVSASLVDAIAKLRAEAETPKPAAAAAGSPLIEPSIFTPTPVGGVSIVTQSTTPAASARAPELPSFMTRPASVSPGSSVAAQPELVVTFSSTPSRLTSFRSPTASAAITAASATFEYVSQAVPLSAPGDFAAGPTGAPKSKPMVMLFGAIAGGIALLLILGIGGYRYFQSSVSQAAAAAAAATVKQFEAAARAAVPPAAKPAPAAPDTPRIARVREPARRGADTRVARPIATSAQVAPSAPAVLSLPDVNLSTGVENALQTNTQRGATSELTRSARATASRTAAPRP